MTTELILISTDCVAHYWEGLGHVSYYRRVDIDALLEYHVQHPELDAWYE